jgi:hypothetical protein
LKPLEKKGLNGAQQMLITLRFLKIQFRISKCGKQCSWQIKTCVDSLSFVKGAITATPTWGPVQFSKRSLFAIKLKFCQFPEYSVHKSKLGKYLNWQLFRMSASLTK